MKEWKERGDEDRRGIQIKGKYGENGGFLDATHIRKRGNKRTI